MNFGKRFLTPGRVSNIMQSERLDRIGATMLTLSRRRNPSTSKVYSIWKYKLLYLWQSNSVSPPTLPLSDERSRNQPQSVSLPPPVYLTKARKMVPYGIISASPLVNFIEERERQTSPCLPYCADLRNIHHSELYNSASGRICSFSVIRSLTGQSLIGADSCNRAISPQPFCR